jgi:3-oxoacyl-(acyl-carrier-protein) synthase
MKQLHRRVVVTGLGILSPIGNTVDDAWHSCIEGISGITTVDVGLENNPVKIGGRLKKLEELIHLFNMELLLQTNLSRILEYLIPALT